MSLELLTDKGAIFLRVTPAPEDQSARVSVSFGIEDALIGRAGEGGAKVGIGFLRTLEELRTTVDMIEAVRHCRMQVRDRNGSPCHVRAEA